MDEYIKRSEAIESFDNPAVERYYGDVSPESVIRVIERIPAADVRPVVLCRDCDCWNDWDSAGKESLGNYVCSCAHWTVEDGAVFYTRPTDFCSYGGMREES